MKNLKFNLLCLPVSEVSFFPYGLIFLSLLWPIDRCSCLFGYHGRGLTYTRGAAPNREQQQRAGC